FAFGPSTSLAGRPIPLRGTISDDGLPAGLTNFYWRVSRARISGIHIEDTNALDTFVTFDWPDGQEDYEIELVASDTFFTVRATVRIRITETELPAIALSLSPDTNVFSIGQTATLLATVSDPDSPYVFVDFYEGNSFFGKQW